VSSHQACNLEHATGVQHSIYCGSHYPPSIARDDQELELTMTAISNRTVKWLFVLSLLSLLLSPSLVWAGDGGAPYPPGSRWALDPTAFTRPQPSLLGTTGYFDLPTSESLRQGNFAIGLFGTFEQVFKTRFDVGTDVTRLDFERYSLILSGAYGILDNLELGVAIPGVTTDAESKQSIAGNISSDDVHETGFGKIRVGLKYRPAELDFSSLRTVGFAGLALEPFVDIQTHGTERGLSYPYRDQDTVYGINLLMGGQAGPIGIHWRLGYSRTDGSNVDNFLVIGSPFNLDTRGFSDGERLSYALAFNFQPTPNLNLILKGDGDTSARHPWDTSQDWRLNALAGAIYGLPNGLAVHAGWQVDLHDPIPGGSTSELDYRIIAGVSYSFAKPVAPPPPPPPAERRVERVVLQSVHFEFDRSRLTPLGRRVLDEAAQKLKDDPRLTVEVEGHTDSIGTELYNLGLGQRRAEVVKGYLVLRHQVDPNRMTAMSYGESRPIADNRTAEGRALNRRVEFKVLIR
jgi:outer membrane protein OmpA-like peptidoglycan-associated protein